MNGIADLKAAIAADDDEPESRGCAIAAVVLATLVLIVIAVGAATVAFVLAAIA